MTFSVNYEHYDKLINNLSILTKNLILIRVTLRLKKKAVDTLKQKYLRKHALKKTLKLL